MAKSNKNTTNRTEEIINQLLINRGFESKKEQDLFFSPLDPKEITSKEFGVDKTQLTKAIKRIKEAIEKKEQVIVYGDYDVDGICATAILWETLNALGAKALPYIPSRFTEGYGLSETGIDNLLTQTPEVKLIITVDSGIVAQEGIEYAKSRGMDVIITDHHQPGEELSNTHAIVHTTQISGSAVAWVLSRELSGSTDLVQEHLGLAALGTISDVLPLVGFNRSIAAFGLRELRNTKRSGIRALCEEAVVKQEEIDTYHIGFMISPRINAAGRVEHAMDSLRLLCTKDPSRAKELARKLGVTNKLRQEKTESVVKHVDELHGKIWKDGNLPKLLFVHHESYEEGVIGIAAGRLVDQYHRPAIVVSIGDEFSKASARSVTGVNIVELLKSAGDDFFKSIGGHPMAAGFTVPTEKLEALVQRLTQISEEKIPDEVLIKTTKFDLEINFEDISIDLYSKLLNFMPFGFGNLEPSFQTKDVQVVDARLVGKEGTHLKLSLSQSNQQFDAIAFKMGKLYPNLRSDKSIEVIYSIDMNEWNNKRNLQLRVRNIKL